MCVKISLSTLAFFAISAACSAVRCMRSLARADSSFEKEASQTKISESFASSTAPSLNAVSRIIVNFLPFSK